MKKGPFLEYALFKGHEKESSAAILYDIVYILFSHCITILSDDTKKCTNQKKKRLQKLEGSLIFKELKIEL